MKFYCDVYCDVYCVFYYIPAFSNLQKQTAKKIKRKWVINVTGQQSLSPSISN